MISFRRAFILATLVGVGTGILLQRVVRERPAVPRVAPTTATLPIPKVEVGREVLSGIVDLPDGRPAAGAAVVATTASGVRSTTADSAGRFVLGGLDPGEVRVDLVLPGYRPVSRTALLPESDGLRWKTGPAYAEVASLPRIERRPLVGRLDPIPESNDFDQGYEVWLKPRGDIGQQALAGVVERRVRVEPTGEFRFEGLAHGEYELSLLPPFARGDDWPRLVTLALDHPSDRGSSGAAPLLVPSAWSTARGRLVDTFGAPVEGAAVLIWSTADPNRSWPLVRSGANGSFEVRHLTDGSFWLEIAAGDARLRERLRLGRGYVHELALDPLDVRADASAEDASSSR